MKRDDSFLRRTLRRALHSPFMVGVGMGLVLNLAVLPALNAPAAAQPTHSTPTYTASGTANATPYPWDPALYAELLGFPAEVHQDIFGIRPADDYLPYTLDEQVTDLGVYTGLSEEGLPFSITVTEILMTAADVAAEIAADPTIDAGTLQWMAANNYEVYAIRCDITGAVGTRDVLAVVASTSSAANGDHHNFTVQSDPTYYDDPFAATWDGPQASSDCSSALSDALDDFDCDGTIVVDQACIDAALLAYDLAVQAAQTDWANAVQTAKDIADAAKAAMMAVRITKIAIALAKCAALAFIPFAGSGLAIRCALKETAKIIAWEIAKRLAIKAALAAAIALADEILELALAAACAALAAALEFCFDCVEVEIEPEEPIEHDINHDHTGHGSGHTHN